jgi:hypothetical protein
MKLRNLLFVFVLVGASLMTACHHPPTCEVNNWGDITFHDDGPSWVWDGCYIEVDWADGTYNTVTFYGTKSYYDKAAGVADLYMEWEDDDSYYWSYGYITLYECSVVDAYCTWSEKKSATVSSFTLVKKGQVFKSNVSSIEEYRKILKK